ACCGTSRAPGGARTGRSPRAPRRASGRIAAGRNAADTGAAIEREAVQRARRYFNRGASPLGLPGTLSRPSTKLRATLRLSKGRAPLRRRAPFAWLASLRSLASSSDRLQRPQERQEDGAVGVAEAFEAAAGEERFGAVPADGVVDRGCRPVVQQ